MKNLAPRVSLTCWHTVLRRWCTKSRFGQRHHSHCTMGCDNQEDSIDHYAHCRVIRTWAQQRLNLHYDPLNSKHVWTQTLATTQENLHKQAHMIYAAYRATNHFRHAGTHTQHPPPNRDSPQNTWTRSSTKRTKETTNSPSRHRTARNHKGKQKKKTSKTTEKTHTPTTKQGRPQQPHTSEQKI